MRELPKRIGQRIREARLLAGLDQAELAKLAGISRRHIVAIEGGANFSVAVLLDIRAALKGYPRATTHLNGTNTAHATER